VLKAADPKVRKGKGKKGKANGQRRWAQKKGDRKVKGDHSGRKEQKVKSISTTPRGWCGGKKKRAVGQCLQVVSEANQNWPRQSARGGGGGGKVRWGKKAMSKDTIKGGGKRIDERRGKG